MVALDVVRKSNSRLKELGPGLVALFGITNPLLAPLPYHHLLTICSRRKQRHRRIHPESPRPKRLIPPRLPRRQKRTRSREDYRRLQGAQRRSIAYIPESGCQRAQRG